MLRRSLTALLAIAATATPALALSCAPFEAAGAYTRANASPNRYVAALGTFTRTGPDLLDPLAADAYPEDARGYSFAARFTGQAGERNGFTRDLDVSVTVQVSCVLSWCGTPVLDEPALAFLRLEGTDYFAEADACPGFLIASPTEAEISEVRSCLRGGCR